MIGALALRALGIMHCVAVDNQKFMDRKPLAVEGVWQGIRALSELIRMPTAAWFGVVAALFYYLNNFMLPSTPVWNRSSDTAVPLTNAIRMVQGQVIYRDFFHFLPPGPELVYVSLIRIAGMHAWMFNAIDCLLGIVLSWLTVRIAIAIVNHTTASPGPRFNWTVHWEHLK
jgi:hypothetical protein